MSTSTTWPGGAANPTPTSYSVPAAGEVNWSNLSNFLNALAGGAQGTTFQKFANRVATTSPVTVSTNDCVVIIQMAVPGAVSVSLPAGSNKLVYWIIDGTGDAKTNNITITPNGVETINGAASYVMNGNDQATGFAFNSGTSNWSIFTNSITAGGSIGGFTASRGIVSDSGGYLAVSATTSTEIGYVSGVTSAIQTQLNTKTANPMTTTGDVIYASNTATPATPARLGVGTTSYALLSTGTLPAWGQIVNASVDNAAAIAYSKLAALTAGNILVGSASNVATSVAVTGDILISDTGVTSISPGVIVNADVNAAAAIDGTKINPNFGSQNISTSGNLNLTAGSISMSGGTSVGITVLSNTTAGESLIAYTATAANSGALALGRSRGSVGSGSIVQDNDRIGALNFSAAQDSSSFAVAASIRAEVDGTPGASNDMPGRLVFLTCADASSTLTERARISNAGAWTWANYGAGILHSSSGGLLTSSAIVNADVSASAAIDFSKLATLSSANILVGSAGNVATSVAVTGDVTITNAGVTAIASGVIVNADVNASAAIAGTKISPDFGSQNIVTTGTISTGGKTIGIVLIATATASNSATIDFTSISNSTYSGYMLIATGVVPATNAVNLVFRISVAGSFLSTSVYEHEQWRFVAAGSGASGSTSDTGININSASDTLSNTSTAGNSFTLWGGNMASTTTRKQFWSHMSGQGSAPIGTMMSGAFQTSASAVDGFRLLMSSGNITAGTFSLYGLRST